MNVTNKKGPVYDPGTCRCCGASKKCRVLNVEYEYRDHKEIYSDLFVECFGLMFSYLDGEPTDRLICAMCVSRLREACAFRRQVLQCEEKLLQNRIHIHGEETSGPAPMLIKTEIIIKEEKEDEDHMESCEDSATDNLHTSNRANDVEVNKKVSADATTTTEAVTAEAISKKPPPKDQARRLLLLRIHKTKETLQEIQRPKTPPEPKRKTSPIRPKFVDEETQIYDNTLIIVENSYVCPFQTSYSTYFCVYCKATFTDPAKLRDHNSEHDPKEFKNVFNSKKTTHIDIERIDCRLCDMNITDMENFKSHIKEEHGKELHNVKEELLMFRLQTGTISCTECDETFVFFHALKRHMAEHFGSFVCDICGAHYFDRRTLDKHRKNCHKSDEKYACHECGKLFRSKHTMLLHVSSVHKKEAAFQCSKCDEVLFSSKERYRHLLEVHGEAKIFPCDVCGKVYTNTKNVREHTRMVHLKIYKHRCGICNRGFAQPSRLNEHVMSMHRNERSFYCDICGKSYPRLHYLKLHIQSHSQET